MKIIQAPNGEKVNSSDFSKTTVFLAGGITNCPDWQADVIKMLEKYSLDDVVVYNPRRSEYPMDDPTQAEIQIKWEFERLSAVDIVLFWFPKESVCPIALYELGMQMGYAQCYLDTLPAAVGVHPEYSRRTDVELQVKLATKGTIPVVTSLKEVVDATVAFIKNRKR